MKKEIWFYESLYKNLKLGFQIKKKLYFLNSPFQKIQILDSHQFKKMLILDGIIQATEVDEFIYHEMIVHVPLLSHPNPQKILVIGGGDGGVLREVLRHPVQEVVMVEIDKEVIEVSKKFLPILNKGAFQDKRAKILIDDGIEFIKNCQNEFDVIIVDSSDPIGPAEGLFTLDFYKNIKKALTENGLAVFQSGSSFLQAEETKMIFKRNKQVFPFVNVYVFAVPVYHGGFFTLTLISKKINPLKISSKKIEEKFKTRRIETKYYNPQIHFASFALPNYIKNYLK